MAIASCFWPAGACRPSLRPEGQEGRQGRHQHPQHLKPALATMARPVDALSRPVHVLLRERSRRGWHPCLACHPFSRKSPRKISQVAKSASPTKRRPSFFRGSFLKSDKSDKSDNPYPLRCSPIRTPGRAKLSRPSGCYRGPSRSRTGVRGGLGSGSDKAARGGVSARLNTSLATILSAEGDRIMATAGDRLAVHGAQGTPI
jgi:hypothetical protein